MTNVFKAIVICLVALAAGCASTGSGSVQSADQSQSPPQLIPGVPVFSGHYRYGFEVASFTQCGAVEQWWVDCGDSDACKPLNDYIAVNDIDRRSANLGFPGGRVFVRWQGTLSEPGRYGHMGGYKRQFTVQRILEIRQPGPSDCTSDER